MSDKAKHILLASLLAFYPFFLLTTAALWQARAPSAAPGCHNFTCCLEDCNRYDQMLYYTLSVCSTIGFGRIYPCTPGPKAASVFLWLAGLPYTSFEVLALTFLAYRLVKWLIAKREAKKLKSRSPEAPETGPENDILVHEEPQQAGTVSNPETDCERCTDECGKNIELVGVVGLLLAYFLLVIYFAAAEKANFGDCLFYAFYAVFAGSLRIEYFESAILLYFLTFCGIVSLFLTITLSIEQFSKSVNTVQRFLSAEAKGFVDAKIVIAEEKFPSLLNEAIEDHVSCSCHRWFLPLFHYYFRDEFFQRVQQYQEMSNLHKHYHSLLSQAAEDQRPSRKFSATTSITNLALMINVTTNTDPPKPKHTAHYSTQTAVVVTVDSETEVHPLMQDFGCHVGTTYESRGDLAVEEMEDISVQTEDNGKTVATQHPEPRTPTTAGRGPATTTRGGGTAKPAGATAGGRRGGGVAGGSSRGARR